MATQSKIKNIPELSIITVVFNDLEGLEETTKSIKENVVGDYEHLVWVNENSECLDKISQLVELHGSKIKIGKDDGIFDAMEKSLHFASGKSVLFLNTKDKFTKSFTINSEFSNYLIPVFYHDFFGRLRSIKVRKTIKRGIPYCHQGMILEKKHLQINGKREFSSDYIALLGVLNATKISWPIPLKRDTQIYYDNDGTSAQNRFVSDLSTAEIVYTEFGLHNSVVFLIKSVIKIYIKWIFQNVRK